MKIKTAVLIWLCGFLLSFNVFAYDFLSGEKADLDLLVNSTDKEILFFWSTHCPYCIDEIRMLNKYCQKLNQDGIKVFFVAVSGRRTRIEKYAKLLDLKCPVVLDDGSLASMYGLIGVPTYIFLYKGEPFGVAHSMSFDDIEQAYRKKEQ